MLLSTAEKISAKEAWQAIKTQCLGAEKVKMAKAQTVKTEFESMNMKETEQLDDFCMRLNGLVTNIRALGEMVEESYVVKKLLRAVPSKFLQIASAIEQFGDLKQMTVEEIVGSLKDHEDHEERLGGQTEASGGQLLLTEEEWLKRENSEGKLLLTREDWLKKVNKGSSSEYRSKDSGHGGRNRNKVICFNYSVYGHYVAECRKPRKEKEQRTEVNMTQLSDDEPALLMSECIKEQGSMMLLNEKTASPNLGLACWILWFKYNLFSCS